MCCCTSPAPPHGLSLPVEQLVWLICSPLCFCVAPQLLFAATLTASSNKEQQSRQAMGARHKGIITYKTSSESTKTLLMLALISPTFHVLAILTLQSGLYWQIPVFSHSYPSTYTLEKLHICYYDLIILLDFKVKGHSSIPFQFSIHPVILYWRYLGM